MSPAHATRKNGICSGTLWKQHASGTVLPPNLSLSSSYSNRPSSPSESQLLGASGALDSNERGRSQDYCVLVGNTLTSYVDVHSYWRGDHPTSEVRIVGASAWNPTPLMGGGSQHGSGTGSLTFTPTPPPIISSSSVVATALASEAVSFPDSTATTMTAVTPPSGPPTFRIVTFAGTHIYCSAPTPTDRDTWLAALHSGLEASYASCTETLSTITSSSSSSSCVRAGGVEQTNNTPRSSSLRVQDILPKLLPHPNVTTAMENTNNTIILNPPPPQRAVRLRNALKRRVSSRNAAASSSSVSSPCSSSHGYQPPYEIDAPPSTKHCVSCGRYPPEPAMKYSSTPLPQYGMENRCNVCQDCLVGQGLLRHVNFLCGLYLSDAHERAALTSARDLVVKTLEAVAAREAAAVEREKERQRLVLQIHQQQHSQQQQRQQQAATGASRTQHEQQQTVTASTCPDIATSTTTTTGATAVDNGREDKRESGSSQSSSSSSSNSAIISGDDYDDDSGEEEITHPNPDGGGVSGSGVSGSGVGGGNDSRGTTSTGESSGWTNVDHTDDVVVEDAVDETQTSSTLSGSWTNIDQLPSAQGGGGAAAGSGITAGGGTPSSSWINLPPSASTTKALLHLISTADFATYRRRSRVLDWNCRNLESGGIGCASEFMENLDECAREASASLAAAFGDNGNVDEEGEGNGPTNPVMGMKKEAFRVAGDMGAAMKLLQDYALPPHSMDTGEGGGGGIGLAGCIGSGNTEMLACILEFLLDLCDEGEIQSVAFFWSQLRSIHLRMLPPRDADALVRVELVEDFLLTVSTRHSVHLALELVWGLIADLEESLAAGEGSGYCSSACRRRRFAVLRFACELESLLFDFDGGWDGGSVSLRGMLSPSQHQAALLRDAVAMLQLHRRFSSHHLTRSARLDKLRVEAALSGEGDESLSEISCDITKSSSEDTKRENLRIAKNAKYFASHLVFIRRLGDIAEKLRFMDVEKRPAALKRELDIMNSSGKFGGDPLNMLLGEGERLATVVHIPSKEGHVFRSKERTPVLLLMEMIREGGPTEDEKVSVSAAKDEKKDGAENQSNRDLGEGTIGVKPSDSEETTVVSGAAGQCIPDEASEPREAATALDGKVSSSERSEFVVAPTSDVGPLTGGAESHHVTYVTDPCKKKATFSSEMAGAVPSANSGTLVIPPSPKPFVGKLKRFESPGMHSSKRVGTAMTPENKVIMEDLVASMMQHQLHLPDLTTSAEKDDGRGGKDDRKIKIMTAPFSSSYVKEDIEGDDKRQECAPAEKNPIANDWKPNFAAEEEPSDHSGQYKEDVADCNKTPDIVEEKSLLDETGPAKEDIARKNEQPDVVGEAEPLSSKSAVLRTSTSSSDRAMVVPLRTRTKQNRGTFQRKISAFGSLSSGGGSDFGDSSSSFRSKPPLAAFGELRREVLTTIMLKGMKGNNIIARGAAPAAQRLVQAMDRRRAVELIMDSVVDKDSNKTDDTEEDSDDEAYLNQEMEWTRSKLAMSLAVQADESVASDDGLPTSAPSEEDETMESLRLLLIQNRVARGDLSLENAARALAPGEAKDLKRKQSGSNSMGDLFHQPVDAGDVDPRLIGCGTLSHAVLSAIRLWQEGIVSSGELLELVQKDTQFLRHSALPGAANASKLFEDSAFWVRFAFGERWAEKKARIAASSMYGCIPGWDLVGVIVKSNDDLRQEAFVMQLIELCQEAFEMSGLELWVHPYRILATGRTTGVIEMVRNAMSFDSLKKRPGYGNGGLRGHLQRMTEFAADPEEAFRTAQQNFVRSLAAYSLMSYVFMFKDRHNGNLLLDTAGHVIHIDFGFVFGIAPGGSFSLEQSVPFKLTEEMLEVMDGLHSPLFSEFVTLFCCGFLALQAHVDTFSTIVEITCKGSSFKCFDGKDPEEVVSKLRERLCQDLDKESTVAFALDLIKLASTSYGTKQYDYFQYLSQGIAT